MCCEKLHGMRVEFLAQENAKVTCRYLTGQDRVLFCDGFGIGVRSDYNGVLLLDTILQKPVASPRDIIKLELLLSEVRLHIYVVTACHRSRHRHVIKNTNHIFANYCEIIANIDYT